MKDEASVQRLTTIANEMRAMITELRAHNNKLYKQNVLLRKAVERHGLDIGRILS